MNNDYAGFSSGNEKVIWYSTIFRRLIAFVPQFSVAVVVLTSTVNEE